MGFIWKNYLERKEERREEKGWFQGRKIRRERKGRNIYRHFCKQDILIVDNRVGKKVGFSEKSTVN